jgi:hypothetical protein
VSLALADGEYGVRWVIEDMPSSATSRVGLIEGLAKKLKVALAIFLFRRRLSSLVDWHILYHNQIHP